MPITTIGSYLPTIQEFINHWNQVNTDIGAAGPLVLQAEYGITDLITDYSILEGAIIAVQPADNTRSNTAANRDIKKDALRQRLTQFRGLVEGQLYGSIYVRSVPTLPVFSANESKYLMPYDDMANLWSQINTSPPADFTPPLVLPGPYTLANFNTELLALRAAYISAGHAIQNATIVREKRDVLLAPVRARLLQYRRAVVGVLPPGSPLLATVPALSPPPGVTPDPVAFTGEWDVAQSKALLTWTPSTNDDLAHYSVRTAPNPNYRARDESVVLTLAPGVTSCLTNVGLVVPGSSALFKVYVVTTTGNERGSNTVRVERP